MHLLSLLSSLVHFRCPCCAADNPQVYSESFHWARLCARGDNGGLFLSSGPKWRCVLGVCLKEMGRYLAPTVGCSLLPTHASLDLDASSIDPWCMQLYWCGRGCCVCVEWNWVFCGIHVCPSSSHGHSTRAREHNGIHRSRRQKRRSCCNTDVSCLGAPCPIDGAPQVVHNYCSTTRWGLETLPGLGWNMRSKIQTKKKTLFCGKIRGLLPTAVVDMRRRVEISKMRGHPLRPSDAPPVSAQL